MDSGYSKSELFSLWDQHLRPVEYQVLWWWVFGYIPEIVTPEDRQLARLRAGVDIICVWCGHTKHRRDYYDDDRKRNGKMSYCKTCHSRLVSNREKAKRKGEQYKLRIA